MSSIPILQLTLSLLLLLAGCKKQKPTESTKEVQSTVGSIVDVILTEAGRKTIGYFIISNGDTSDINFIFSEEKDGKAVFISFSEPEPSTVTYRQKLEQLKQVLPEAAKDFRIDSLDGALIRFLSSNGDIAIDVTEEFMKLDSSRFEYGFIESFLKDSKLARDMNETFADYSIKVKRFYIEKLHYTSKEDLLWISVIERDTATIPDKVIDCIIRIEFEPIK